jgi:hypothetical protein
MSTPSSCTKTINAAFSGSIILQGRPNSASGSIQMLWSSRTNSLPDGEILCNKTPVDAIVFYSLPGGGKCRSGLCGACGFISEMPVRFLPEAHLLHGFIFPCQEKACFFPKRGIKVPFFGEYSPRRKAKYVIRAYPIV